MFRKEGIWYMYILKGRLGKEILNVWSVFVLWLSVTLEFFDYLGSNSL